MSTVYDNLKQFELTADTHNSLPNVPNASRSKTANVPIVINKLMIAIILLQTANLVKLSDKLVVVELGWKTHFMKYLRMTTKLILPFKQEYSQDAETINLVSYSKMWPGY